jgi:hypothetical protein
VTNKIGARSFGVTTLFACLHLFSANLAIAQETATPQQANQAIVLGVNAGLGAFIAVVGRVIANKPVRNAAFFGALGGTASYIGKRVIARSDPKTNLLGREFSAAGASVVANAGSGTGPLNRFVFPYGPLRFQWDRDSSRSFSAKLDIATTLETAWVLHKGGVQLDMTRTISSGAPVFRVATGKEGDVQLADVGGSQLAGVILHRDQTQSLGEASATIDRTLGHELVHVAQYDFSFIALAAPIEKSILQQTTGGTWINKYVDLGLNVPLWSALNVIIPYQNRPWEIEAVTFSHIHETPNR